jgi:hypothetical protein
VDFKNKAFGASSQISLRIKIKFKSDFETKDIFFPKMESNDFRKASTEFWF